MFKSYFQNRFVINVINVRINYSVRIILLNFLFSMNLLLIHVLFPINAYKLNAKTLLYFYHLTII